MKENKKKNRRQWAEKNKAFLLLGGLFLGSLLGTILVYISQGEWKLEGIVANSVFLVIGVSFVFIRRKFKKNSVPDVDERVKLNITRFYLYSAHIFLALLFLALGILTFLEKDSVPLSYLWIFFVSYITITGLGGLIAKKM